MSGNAIRRVLVMALCGVGDTLFFLPALANLRAALPGATFDAAILANGVAGLLDGAGIFDRVTVLPFAKYLPPEGRPPAVRRWGALCLGIAALRRCRYDLAFWPFAYTTAKKVVLASVLGAHRTFIHIGQSPAARRTWSRRVTLVPFRQEQHVVERNLGLLRAAGLPGERQEVSLRLSEREEAWGRECLGRLLGDRRPAVALHPGGNLTFNRDRQWPPEAFVALGKALAVGRAAGVLVLGTAAERPLLEAIAADIPGARPVSGLSLSEVTSLLQALDLVIGNDSALVHVADAVGTPALMIAGPTDPRQTAPWGGGGRVIRLDLPCSPCFPTGFAPHCPHHLCLQALRPADVLTVALRMLDDRQVSERAGPAAVVTVPAMDLVQGPEFQAFLVRRKVWGLIPEREPAEQGRACKSGVLR